MSKRKAAAAPSNVTFRTDPLIGSYLEVEGGGIELVPVVIPPIVVTVPFPAKSGIKGTRRLRDEDVNDLLDVIGRRFARVASRAPAKMRARPIGAP